MINSPGLSPDSISIFSPSTRPITTGRRWATLPAATTTTGWAGLSLITAMAGTSGTFDRCSASISMPTCVPGCSSVGVSNASVTQRSSRRFPEPDASRPCRQIRAVVLSPSAIGAGGRADDESRRVGDRQRHHHLHLFRIDEPQNRIAHRRRERCRRDCAAAR